MDVDAHYARSGDLRIETRITGGANGGRLVEGTPTVTNGEVVAHS